MIINSRPNYFFTVDTHFGQYRTLELSKRPFNTVEEMDSVLISNWNKTVGTEDIVFHLGDFGENTSYVPYLHGHIMFVPARTYDPKVIDELAKCNTVTIIQSGYFVEVCGMIDDCLLSQRMCLIHEPLFDNSIPHIEHDTFFLFGHIHKLQMIKKNGLNVGVDCHNFCPIDEQTVLFYWNAIQKRYYDNNVFTCDCQV